MEFIDLTSASEDERFQVKGILSNVSRNLEFACGNKLKVNSKERAIPNGNQKEQNIKKSINQQHITEQAQSNNYKNVNGNHYNYNYNNNNLHHGIDENNHYSNSNHYHQNNNHQAHYNHHHSSQHHNNHYSNVQNNHNSRMPTVIPAYSTPFIHGHPVSNGAIQQDSHYKMPFYPQYPNSSKPFYPTNGPNGPHFTNVITNIPPIAATLGTGPPAPITTNGVVSTNQMSDVLAQSDITGQNPHLRSNPNSMNDSVIVSSYQMPTGYTSGHAPANSFMPAQYISAHPSAHFTPHPMFYLPLHMTQIYPSHYPPHLGNPQPATILTAPHQQLATPPISPQQSEELSNADDYLNEDSSKKSSESNNSSLKENVNKEKSMQSLIDNQSSLSTYSFSSDKNKSKSSLKSSEKYDYEENQNSSIELSLKDEEIKEKDLSEKLLISEKNDSSKSKDDSSLSESNQSENSSEGNFFDSSKKINENLSSSIDNLEIHSAVKEELLDLKSDLNDTENKEDLVEKSKSSAKSWADLFKSGNLNYKPTVIDVNNYQQKDNSLFNTDDFTPLGQHLDSIKKLSSQLTIKTVDLEEDELVLKLVRKIRDINLKHSLPLLTPRGFTNDGNWCYINSILQALLYCPPFYNLMREIGETPGIFREKSATPVIDSFAKFFTNFMPNEQLMRKVKSSSSFGYEDLPKLEPYEPKCIYNVLGNINNECLKGQQEDAEEFLSSVLNCLNKEMILLLNYDQKNNQNKAQTNIKENSLQNENLEHSSEEEKWSNQDNKLKWKEVKTKHKTLATNNCKITDTPITDIFGGTMLFIRTAGKDINYNRQPFFSLKLDIQSDKIRTVEDALRNLTMSESIHGYVCPKTNKIIDASSQTFLDQLPAILVLHLKLYTDKDGHLKKSLKKIDFPIVLEMPKECLTTQDRSKYSKTYKLLAVVHHDGKDAAKGHYFTDIYHIGTSLWLRCSDSSIESISVQQLMHPQNSKVPYLLFYRRCDTLRSSSKNLTVIS